MVYAGSIGGTAEDKAKTSFPKLKRALLRARTTSMGLTTRRFVNLSMFHSPRTGGQGVIYTVLLWLAE
jgi:hypothetical protein